MSSFNLSRLTRGIARRMFPLMERGLDLHVTPNDYYSPIPSVKDLPADVYDKPFSLTGIDMNAAAQMSVLEDVFPRYIDEFTPEPNGGLSLVDAFALYALLRDRKPKRMVEIGGGHSTFITMHALEANRSEGFPCHFSCVEPYPRDFLRNADWPDFELVVDQVQNIAPSFFDDVDVLFIDSSHVSKIGSDVNHEMFEIVPRLKVGCLIHWHDIVIPTNYWRDWTESGIQFWNESYLLHAFLLFNDRFQVLWAARWFKMHHGDALSARFPYLKDEHRLTSFWIERKT